MLTTQGFNKFIRAIEDHLGSNLPSSTARAWFIYFQEKSISDFDLIKIKALLLTGVPPLSKKWPTATAIAAVANKLKGDRFSQKLKSFCDDKGAA